MDGRITIMDCMMCINPNCRTSLQKQDSRVCLHISWFGDENIKDLRSVHFNPRGCIESLLGRTVMNTICGQGIRVAEDFDNRLYDKYDTDPTPYNQELEQLP